MAEIKRDRRETVEDMKVIARNRNQWEKISEKVINLAI